MENNTTNQNMDENKNLVHGMIRQMLPSLDANIGILSYDDLYQEGMIGLWRAYEEFDPSREAKFSTFACNQIRFAILNCLNKQQYSIKFPTKYTTEEKRDIEYETLYLNQTVKGDSGQGSTELINVLEMDSSLCFHQNTGSEAEETVDVKNSLSVLKDKERRAIEKYYFEDKFPKDISKEEGVTRQAIELRIKNGLKKLKTSKQLAYA